MIGVSPWFILGVDEGCKAHRMYDPVKRKIVVSRDVIFEESVQWKWNTNSGEDVAIEFTVEESAIFNPVWGSIAADEVAQQQGGAQQHGEDIPAVVTEGASTANSNTGAVVIRWYSKAGTWWGYT